MNVTNLTQNYYYLDSNEPLAPGGQQAVLDADYLDRSYLRENINTLYADNKISVANPPAGFPILFPEEEPQPHIADVTAGGTTDANARAKIAELIDALERYGVLETQ